MAVRDYLDFGVRRGLATVTIPVGKANPTGSKQRGCNAGDATALTP